MASDPQGPKGKEEEVEEIQDPRVLTAVPHDVIPLVAAHLPLEDVNSLRQVCKRLHNNNALAIYFEKRRDEEIRWPKFIKDGTQRIESMKFVTPERQAAAVDILKYCIHLKSTDNNDELRRIVDQLSSKNILSPQQIEAQHWNEELAKNINIFLTTDASALAAIFSDDFFNYTLSIEKLIALISPLIQQKAPTTSAQSIEIHSTFNSQFAKWAPVVGSLAATLLIVAPWIARATNSVSTLAAMGISTAGGILGIGCIGTRAAYAYYLTRSRTNFFHPAEQQADALIPGENTDETSPLLGIRRDA